MDLLSAVGGLSKIQYQYDFGEGGETDMPGARIAVSRKGTIGFDAWISTLANRSRRSFRQRLKRKL